MVPATALGTGSALVGPVSADLDRTSPYHPQFRAATSKLGTTRIHGRPGPAPEPPHQDPSGWRTIFSAIFHQYSEYSRTRLLGMERTGIVSSRGSEASALPW